MNIIKAWQAMSEAEQIKMLTSCITKATQAEIPAASLARFTADHDTADLLSEAWLKLYDRLQPDYLDALDADRIENGKEPIGLVSIVYRAAKSAVRNAHGDDPLFH